MKTPTKEEKEQRTIQRLRPNKTWETVGSFGDLEAGDIFRLFEYDGTEIQMKKGNKAFVPGRFRVQGRPFKYENPKEPSVKKRLAEAIWAVNCKSVWRTKERDETIEHRKMKAGSTTDEYGKREIEVKVGDSWEARPLMHVKDGDTIRYLEEGEYFEHVALGNAFYDDKLFPPCWAITIHDEVTNEKGI